MPSEYSTLQAAADVTNPGDVVFVGVPGSYRGANITRSGTAAQPVVFRSVTGVVINQGSATNSDGFRLQNVSYISVEGFDIDATSMSGRCVAARGATATAPMRGDKLVGLKCRNAAHEGFYLSQFSEGLVERCTIAASGRDGTPRGHGLYLANGGSDRTTIRGNHISGTVPVDSAGIHLNGDLSIGGDGLIQDVVIELNVITGNNHNGVNADGVQRAVIRGNLITANARSGVRGYAIDGAAGPSAWVVVNNTIVGNSAWAVKFSEDAGGHVLFNNLLLGSTGSLCVGSTVQSNHNRFAGALSRDEEVSTVSLSTWQSLTLQDAASAAGSAAALFVSSTDSHLLASSSARNGGVASFANAASPTVDLDGTSRPRGPAVDLGAYEFVE